MLTGSIQSLNAQQFQHNDRPSRQEGIAFPHLTPRDLEQLRPFGTPCSYEDGQVVFSAGDDAADLFIVESGAMEILNPAQDNRSVVTHGPVSSPVTSIC
jgi:CRP-like cAMP-binding protein